MRWKTGLSAALLLTAATHLLAQEIEIRPIRARSAAEANAPIIKAISDLVLVPVHVMDRAGATVNGLPSGAFAVMEDKKPQNIVSFGNEDTPCSLGVILDLSGSMSNKLSLASSALHSFLETANPEDEAFLLTVSTQPKRISDFTTDFGTLQNRLLSTETGGATALIDTIHIGLAEMKQAKFGHKALLVISDGMDNHSRYSASELMREAEEADVQIYTIAVETWGLTKKPIELAEERNGMQFLRTLSERTGGLDQSIRNYNDAPGIAATLSRAIREQYLLGYHPDVRNDSGKWHSIQVTVTVPRAHVAFRNGYLTQ
jgi:Ca-activated chloride channel family protein